MATYNKIYSTYRFYVEIKGITEATFTECQGLQAEMETEDWEEGGLNSYVHRLPGRVKSFPNLKLKRGIATTDLWKWYYNCANGTIKRYNLSIIIYGYDNDPSIRWDVTGALPIKWEGPSLKADANEVAFESIELVHHGFARVA